MVVCRTEFFGKHAVNVFETQNDSQNFSQSIASMKNLQGDNQSFYVCNLGSVINSLQQWFTMLPRISPFYSVRCNSDAVLLRLLAAHPNVGLHCITREDLDTATEIIPSGRILYANPCWTRGSLRNAAASQVGLITIETMGDFDRVLSTFPQATMLLNVGMSTNQEDPATELGCTFEDACDILQKAAEVEANICGISFNIGSGCRDPTLYSSAIQTCSELFKVAKNYGLQMNVVNVGGGFSNASFDKYNDFASFVEICVEINAALDYYFPLENFSDLRVIAQPGRFFAGDAFQLSTCIIGKQAVDLADVTHDDFDLGSQAYIYQINEGYYGAFGCQNVANCDPKCIPLFENEADYSSSQQFYGNVIGPTFDEYDIAQSMCHLRQMSIGDWLAWPKMGAYSRNNRASLGDVDIPAPAVYYYCNTESYELCQRLLSLESAARPKSIASTQLTTRRSSFALSLLGGSDAEDECYGSLSDFGDAFSFTDESNENAEEEWMARFQFQGPIFD
uniref:Ornithine decarboxylase n=1 Tax=Panagrolaimus superbus TaxID=310955 RepID=A0A914XV93_9BILA